MRHVRDAAGKTPARPQTVMKPRLIYRARLESRRVGVMVRLKVAERSVRLGRLARRLALGLVVCGLGAVGWLLYCEHENSVEVAIPQPAELRSSRDRAAAWVLRNRNSVLAENNSMLWLFVREAGRLSGDPRLQSLTAEYRARSTRGTLAEFFFIPADLNRAREASIILGDEWEDYQRLFVYGATCNLPLRSDPEVVAMLSPSACDREHAWLRNPWCRTHQLMGLRFVQRNRCDPDEDTARTIQAVQSGILTELNWDFRVEDAYLQKVWTLIESGRRNEIKAVWIRRILDAQGADGGWSGVDVIAHLPGRRVICWQGGGLHPRLAIMPESNFHATAQALYLMALLSNE
jgi:hypothetical protein